MPTTIARNMAARASSTVAGKRLDLVGDDTVRRDARYPKSPDPIVFGDSASTARRTDRRDRTGHESARSTVRWRVPRGEPPPASRAARGPTRRRGSRARRGSGPAGGAGGRRTGAFPSSSSAGSRSRLSLPDLHGRERLERNRARHVAGDALLKCQRGLGVHRTAPPE